MTRPNNTQQAITTKVNNSHAVIITSNGAEYLYTTHHSLHVCQATRDAVSGEISRHGAIDVRTLPAVHQRINRHGRTVRFTQAAA